MSIANRQPPIVNEQGIQPVQYVTVSTGSPKAVDGFLVEESQICISINGDELAYMMASPSNLDQLALGFLANEGIISSLADVRHLHIAKNGTCADVWLHDMGFEKPRKFIKTAGCGGGVTFDDLSQEHDTLQSELQASPEQLAHLMREMHLGAELYQQARGIHTAVLATPDNIVLQVEDIGRHNTLDRLRGAALQQQVDTRDHILLSSGRISSEMLNKARRLGCPIVASRTSPTTLSVKLAETWGITIVAYLRQDRMRVYTHPERMGLGT